MRCLTSKSIASDPKISGTPIFYLLKKYLKLLPNLKTRSIVDYSPTYKELARKSRFFLTVWFTNTLFKIVSDCEESTDLYLK